MEGRARAAFAGVAPMRPLAIATNLGSWPGFGAPMTVGRPDVPGGWRCGPPSAFGTYIRYRCRLRTSFGGTRPERTFRLVFRYDPYVGPR